MRKPLNEYRQKVAVIGHGEYGSAIASLLEYNCVEYDFITRSKKIEHEVDVIFITVPTQSIREALQSNKNSFHEDTIFVNCSKGIEEKTHLLPFEIISEIFPVKNYATVIGPSFAGEVIDHNPTVVSLGYNNNESSKIISDIIETPYFSTYTTSDYEMLELSGALKNVYAILSGYAKGIGFGKNTNVRIILSAQKELEYLADSIGYTTNNLYAPGIIGDLILTCGSSQSRNYTYGYNLAQKNNVYSSDIATLEGYHTCKSIGVIARKNSAYMPLAELTARIVNGERISKAYFVNTLSNTL